MKKLIGKTAILLSLTLSISCLYGCGSESAEPEVAETEVTETVDEDDPNDGLGDLIEEDDPDKEPVMNEMALKGPSYTGLTNIYLVNNEDGTYMYEDMTEDGLTVISNMSFAETVGDGQKPEDYVTDFIDILEDGEATVTEVKADETLSAALTYPTYRVYWETGSNEDSRQSVGVIVLTDFFVYYYSYGCPLDFYEENADFYESELDSLELIDLSTFAELSDEAGDEYEDIYFNKIEELEGEGLIDQYTIAYIDEDDVPELIASDSTGSFDHENAYIFTVSNNEAVLLASVIAGVDGGNLDYAEGKNLIHVSGAAAGMRDTFSEIKDGKLDEVFSAEATSMDEDAKYSVNGKDVDEEEYYKHINDFIEPYGPMTRVAYDGLYEVSYKYENGYGSFEQGASQPY
ncbi:MAG: hypothetical protein K5888_03745 [Lachnospiraceae bacterium]|nr:hypothetical protein [Lachnospiraceae bacterium]